MKLPPRLQNVIQWKETVFVENDFFLTILNSTIGFHRGVF
ncbi:hypothetical protein SAMN02745166_00336 [Prosthecobacter debontii]|uniref:Uncharacterized protein n=1 Tax=Prosthecobacter debontii TaxID=48467 RepID=A0A1T4WIP9_9BACT|nr:hypothetical protein SAMN02745166_00336 [Prosthecobacter debontii]